MLFARASHKYVYMYRLDGWLDCRITSCNNINEACRVSLLKSLTKLTLSSAKEREFGDVGGRYWSGQSSSQHKSPEVAIFALLPLTRCSILDVVYIIKKPRPEAGNTAPSLQPLTDCATETITIHLPLDVLPSCISGVTFCTTSLTGKVHPACTTTAE